MQLKIPTPIGLLLLVGFVGSVIFFSERFLRSPSGASGSQQPVQIKITNVSDTTFTVSWTTESPATGAIEVSTAGKSNRLYYDERDGAGRLGKYTGHSVSVRDARPASEYSVKVLSNGRKYLDNNKPISLRTPDTLPPNASGLEPAYGTVRTADGMPAGEALVYLIIAGGQELSALTKSSGVWLIPLAQTRTSDLTSFLPTLERMDETITVLHSTGESSGTTDSLNDSPVPDITLGQTFDFRRQNAKAVTNPALAVRTTPASVPQPPPSGAVLGNSANAAKSVTLQTPAQNASLPTTLPLIGGSGVPNKFVALSIGITNPMSGSTKVKADGTWSFVPTRPLPPGRQSVTITTQDASNKPVAITHTFEILKSGTQVLGDATPSATLTLTLTPTPTTVATPTATATPIEVPESTLSGQEMPTSGYELPTLVLVLIGMGLLLGGGAALFW